MKESFEKSLMSLLNQFYQNSTTDASIEHA